jgi:hypothetical protein
MTIGVIYDPRHLSWDQWASLMCEAYAGQQLEIPQGEDNWQDWARGLHGIGLFSSDAVPSPSSFQNWQDWAQAVVGAVANQTQATG